MHRNRLNLSSVTRACVQRLELESESHSRGRSRASSKSSSKSPTSATGQCARDVMKQDVIDMRQRKQGRVRGKVRVSSRDWGRVSSRERRDETESRAEFGARVGSGA